MDIENMVVVRAGDNKDLWKNLEEPCGLQFLLE